MSQEDDLKVPSSRKSEKVDDVCMLELLNSPRVLPNSCFSESQIDLLFGLWRQFMLERFQAGESCLQKMSGPAHRQIFPVS